MSRKFSSDLNQLIQSLTRDEKRYFSRNASVYLKKGTNYLELFQAFSSSSPADTKELSRRVPSVPLHQLSNSKSYLYTLVLDTLSDLHQKSLAEGKARSLLLHAELLFNKRLTVQSALQLKKARLLSEQFDLGRIKAEILVLEETLLNETARGDELEERLEEIFREGTELIEEERRIHGLRHLLSKVSRYFRQTGLMRDKKEIEVLHQLISDPLLLSPPEKEGFREKYFRLNISGMHYLLMRNWSENFKLRQQLIHHFRDAPHMKKEMKKAYISSLNNYILACEFVKNFRELESAFFEVREMFHDPANSANKHLRLRIMGGYSSMLHSCIVFGEFEKGREIYKEIEAEFEELKGQINKASAVSFYYTFAYIHFGCGDHRKALQRLYPILNDKELDVRDDILVFAHLFNLIIHFESGNERTLETFIRSTDRFLQSKTTHLKTERLIHELFAKKLLKAGSRKEERAVFQQTLEQLNVLVEDKVEARALEYFDFQSWLGAKLSGKDFGELVRKKVSSVR